MIYTVTFNPAVDYVMTVKNDIAIGEVNRSEKEEMFFGGKGINVSVVLKELGIPSKALGFCAGFTGLAIENGIRAVGIETDFVHLESGNSRINVKIKGVTETDLNGQGPSIDNGAVEKLFQKLDKLIEGDILVLAGSVPDTLPADIYETILERLSDKNVHFVVDATKDLLVNTLNYKPFLVKPNNFELGEIFGVKLNSNDEIIHYAKKLRDMGAKNVLVSMAGDGSILLDESGEVHTMGAPRGETINSVGAGDSMVAGFIAGYVKKRDYEYALTLGTASGSATAFSEGLAKKNDIYRLFSSLQSEKSK